MIQNGLGLSRNLASNGCSHRGGEIPLEARARMRVDDAHAPRLESHSTVTFPEWVASTKH